MIALLASAVVAGYLPGALIFRLPVLDRHRRAALDPAERVFWAAVISATLTLTVSLALAAVGQYQWRYVLVADLLVATIAVAAGRRGLAYNAPERGDWWGLAPVALVALSLWVFPPPAEYVIGGKDPGVYMNAGVQIAQRGSLVIDDELVASLPAETRGPVLSAPPGNAVTTAIGSWGSSCSIPTTVRWSTSSRIFIPAAIAIGYDLAGLTGARYISAACAVFGVLALYFLGREADWQACRRGRRGSADAPSGAGVACAGFPTRKSSRRACSSRACWRWARAHQDDDAFFAPVAGLLFGLLPFARFDGVLAVGLAAAGLALHWSVGGRCASRLWRRLTAAVGALHGLPVYVACAVRREAADVGDDQLATA